MGHEWLASLQIEERSLKQDEDQRKTARGDEGCGAGAKQFEALEKEARRIDEQAASRQRGVRIVSANGRFAAHVQCDRFSAQFDGKDFAIEMHTEEAI
jgi:hypothetical protein